MADDDGGPAASRTRRRATKAVNYAKEQEFSDASDIFQDSEPDEPKFKKRGRGRKSDTNEPTEDDDDGYKKAVPVYTERGYDPAVPPIRERFPFLPEFEADGSPRIELIVGRRPIDEDGNVEDEEEEKKDDLEADEEQEGTNGRRRSRSVAKPKSKASPETKMDKGKDNDKSGPVEYEYLIKYRGRSYLHLDWKTGGDLESMGKTAKTMYRRFLKKMANGDNEELEDPVFDESFVLPQRILDEAKQEITVELSDKELLKWEKQRAKELAAEGSSDSDGDKKDVSDKGAIKEDEKKDEEMKAAKQTNEKLLDWEENEIDFKNLSLDRLRKMANADGPYYPVFEGSTNPYRDGYVTEPPKKPRASYLFFQCTMRSYYKKRFPNASVSELMSILGEQWNQMTEEEQAPFMQLAKEEAKQHQKEQSMLEKAQKPNEVWQPIRRCSMVLKRLQADGFASIFLKPVDMKEFPDYDEYVDTPMDLGTVETRLNTKKYLAPEQFARDVRKVWHNCKIYNQHGSAIWHVADYMSKQFERLYHAWVLDFRERYIRWAKPSARPWEDTCRQCDGKCNSPDSELVVCDHCDAPYGIKCLPQPLKKLPKGIWHCADCKPRLHTLRGARMLSAVAENAARKRAELGDTPKKTINQTMYLVKWMGLGYECCTWETKEDINDPTLIAEFHKLNNTYPDEPDMPESIVNKTLSGAKHLNMENVGGSTCLPELRTQLYAQTRALQFSKFGMEMPDPLCAACGPKAKAANIVKRFVSDDEPSTGSHGEMNGTARGEAISFDNVNSNNSVSMEREVVEVVSSLTDVVAKDRMIELQSKVNESLPPLLTGEYDAIVPITSKGLMMNVGEIHGSVAFLGYRSFPDGSRGPSEIQKLIKNVGDKIIAVDGQTTINKSFTEVIGMLKESGKNKFAFMRFLETRYSVCDSDMASTGVTGRYAFEELQKKFAIDRERLLIKRKQQLMENHDDLVEEAEESDGSAAADTDDESEGDSEGEFQPDSDAEADELMKKRRKPKKSASFDSVVADEKPVDDKIPGTMSGDPAETLKGIEEVEKGTVEPIILRHEKTQSLAHRLLDVDIGNSSDEGGDDSCVYFMDGVDTTFTSMTVATEDVKDLIAEPSETDGEKFKVDQPDKKEKEATVPVKRNEFSELGERSKLAASVLLVKVPPEEEDFDNFPYPSSKAMEAEKAEHAKKAEDDARSKIPGSPEAGQQGKKSSVKIEQVDHTTGEVVNVWANIQSAAATLQIPLNDMKQYLAAAEEGQYNEDIGETLGGFSWRYALTGAEVTAGLETTGRGKKGREAWLEFREKLYDPSEPHPYKNGNRLRDYQVDGVNWLASTYYKRHGCILADEMGLGKTVQIVAYIEHLYRVEKIKRPYLVVVPLSTVEHWRREFEGWTDMVCCVYHDRQRVWRDVLREYEWYYKDRPHTADFLKFDVLVTTYDTLIGDFDVISQIPFRVSVVDEAHRLRNQKGKLLECMREISAKGNLQYGFQSRVLMSGTPLQNDLTELWVLLNFIEPFKFPDLDDFQASFGNMANRAQVEALQAMISPYMLRRIKEDVATDIPSKEETVIDVELTSLQKTYYRAIFEHNHAFLSMGATRTNAPKLMNIQMELRKVCNHPFLLEGIEHRETDRQYREFQERGAFEDKTPGEQHQMITEQGMIMCSGKMVLLDKLLPKLRQEGHKILIFSQMVKMLDLISEYCEFRTYPYERLDGRVRGTERQKSIDRFETDPNAFLFLLSTRAGGVGINLTAADICIIFDSDWNPQNDVQAQARCHRIGQTKDVKIFRLVTSRTFEQEMFDRASKKLGLEQAVLGTFEQADDDDKPTNQEMEQLLKKGAYALLQDENDEEGKAFCSDDIENILAKRTRTRVIEGAKSASWLNKQGMVVSKSKFSSEAGAQLDMDDPNFWQKVMPDFVTPSIMVTNLDELSLAVLGKSTKKKKSRRGHGRWKKKYEAEAAAKAAAELVAQAAGASATIENPPENGAAGQSAAVLNNDTIKGTSAAEMLTTDESQPGNGEMKSDAMEFDLPPKDDESMADAEQESNSGEDIFKVNKAATKDDEEVESCEKENNDDGDDGDDDNSDEESDDEETKEKKMQLTRTNQRKVAKFISDMKSMMESVLDEAEDGSLPAIEKETCQELLLQISINQGLFNEQQRHYARSMLKKLEGDRRRRCRTSDTNERFTPGRSGRGFDDESSIPEALRIVSSKKVKRKRRKKWEMERDRALEAERKRRGLDSDDELDTDTYKYDSDDPGNWSDVADDIKKKSVISRKEAKRRRQWAADDDVATAAGRPWPVFPRDVVSDVLRTVIEEVMKLDEEIDGVFSVPVPKDEFPEYYEQIKKPMDYGTIKKKVEKGEYRSAQAMQKDLILVMQNCLQFNSPNSDIVKEARQQALRRPSILRKAAEKHDLFLTEDGSVLKIVEEYERPRKTKIKKRKRRRRNPVTGELEDPPPSSGDEYSDELAQNLSTQMSMGGGKKRKRRRRNPETGELESPPPASDEEEKQKKTKRRRKRNKITGELMPLSPSSSEGESTPGPKKKREKPNAAVQGKDDSQESDSDNKPIASLKKRSSNSNSKKETALVNAAEKKEALSQEEKDSIFRDVNYWKSEREKLDGSFMAARSLFTKHGPWKISEVDTERKFRLIAKSALTKMGKHDGFSVFATYVSDSEAPGYSDVIKEPMNFGKMREKIEAKEYGTDENALTKLYEDFMLIFDNCALYNDDNEEVTTEAARVFALLPETFAASAAAVLKKNQNM